MKTVKNKKIERLCIVKAALLILVLLCAFLLPNSFTAGSSFSVAADSYDVMRIDGYDVDMTVNTDYTVRVRERIVMTPRISGDKFRRSLPIEGDRYYDVKAECVGESEFFYFVEENEDGDFLDIVCQLETPAGTTRTYDISYTMELGSNDVENGMHLDVVGFGWTVALHNVSVTMHFPANATINRIGIMRYGEETPTRPSAYTLSQDGKTLTLQADVLEKYYNVYGEYVAEGIGVEFAFANGVMQDLSTLRRNTENLWKYALGGLGCVALAVLCATLLKKRREMITTVNITAPDNMDPMKMGKLIDGSVDSEDVTSMIYYFAYKGYLTISLEDEENPTFTKTVEQLPKDASAHEKTLFNGLFKRGNTVGVADLKEKFFETVDAAKLQISTPRMYETKSWLGFVLGGVFGLLYATLCGLLTGMQMLGQTYGYFGCFSFVFPISLLVLINLLRSNNRYKWKKGTKAGTLFVGFIIAAVFTLLFVFAFATHLMTEWEKFVICIAVFLSTFVTGGTLSYTEEYSKRLGDILGFKDFIVVTEEDKIKFMLEENPQLYYKILPYAQVLGVTDEWEDKFKDILIEPPTWYSGGFTVFDYMLLNRCMRAGMMTAMMRPHKGGSFTGSSGGGGFFGGFGGGGHGGGGGSWS